MLDQEIAPARPLPEQSRDLMRGIGVDLAALRRRLGPPPPLPWMFEGTDFVNVIAAHLEGLTAAIIEQF
ncbi:MAG: hypothetical protein AB1586_30215 [Pseudomonadota bacterium]